MVRLASGLVLGSALGLQNLILLAATLFPVLSDNLT